jgi:predicted nucleic acid-binding protein
VKPAYVDTSCLVAIAFSEPGYDRTAQRLERCDRLFASNLLEAEFRSALKREDVSTDGESLMSWLTWVFPDRPLTAEYAEILKHGYVSGADLWHLACALYLRRLLGQLEFLTLDDRQQRLSEKIGLGEAL